MRRNHPKHSRKPVKPEDRYDTEYIFMPDRPDVKRIIHHPRKVILVNMDAWPLVKKEIVIRHGWKG